MTADPIRFAFGLHVHQPVGNFDHVFEEHVERVYLPFLQALEEREILPITLHVSGPLIEWLESHDSRYLDVIGRLASDGRLELLAAGMYEPVLAVLPRADRLEQIEWMRDALGRMFGIDARGLWLTERVWEPGLVGDLAKAGIAYALLDDRHFLVAGFEADALHRPFRTEDGGASIALLPIDERLRYLVPFRPPEETADYLRSLRADGHELAVLADDGEKFGGWPDTHEWLYDQGWLERFFGVMTGMITEAEVRLVTCGESVAEVASGGLAYLPSASYREMEAWSLPAERAVVLHGLEAEIGKDRMEGPVGTLIRGGHWRNFMVKYPEANRMHKKMIALSELSRKRGDPGPVRRAIGRAQCNDAYWHGVFGGLYLTHLRQAVWACLAQAEGLLREGEGLDVEVVDIDHDGHDEIWVHSAAFSAILSPRRGGRVEEWTVFSSATNYADALTRRTETYHLVGNSEEPGAEGSPVSEDAGATPAASGDEGMPSIHDRESGVGSRRLPPVDLDDRALLVDRFLPPGVEESDLQTGAYRPDPWPARVPMNVTVECTDGRATIRFATDAIPGYHKTVVFSPEGGMMVEYRWDPATLEADSRFATELSLSQTPALRVGPGEVERSSFRIETASMSEGGVDLTDQGESVTFLWPGDSGRAWVEILPEPIPYRTALQETR